MKSRDRNIVSKGGSGSSSPAYPSRFSAEYLRQSYLDFFEERAHRIIASAPLVPQDPTLLFTSAGMVQFKAHYSDPDSAPYLRAASVQKCLRAGGKQSDLENVGRTLRHHTFFEMLGNFSFGDYFKKDAIEYAWELVIDVWNMDKSLLWISVYEEDQEAYDLWHRLTGLPKKRVVRLGKKENFWGPVGDTGVCGPSSELYYDTGEARGCGKKSCKPGCDCDRYIEFWNLVFPQFFLTEKGIYDPLPRPGIDTGLGLERVAFILQGVEDNFHTDLFDPVRRLITLALPPGTEDKKATMAVNVATDHLRALCFTMAEGIIPSNEGRGYILRRLLRRSLTKMHPFGVRKPFLSSAVDAVIEIMGVRYPELKERADFMKKVITAEEERFIATLEQGLDRLGSIIARCKSGKSMMISGDEAFVLYDTYGFPPELTNELALDVGLSIDMEGFARAMSLQKEKARSGRFRAGAIASTDKKFVELRKLKETKFLGYDNLSCRTRASAFRLVERVISGSGANGCPSGIMAEVITEGTVFYPEGGGQVGDTGTMTCGRISFDVMDTYSLNSKIVHFVCFKGDPGSLGPDEKAMRELLSSAECVMSVNNSARSATARNHTATHLLHAALRKVLGEHVVQAGSLVAPDRLRFDFHHYRAMSQEEIRAVEEFVNRAVLSNLGVKAKEMPHQEAMRAGVIALFGEKYGDRVRVVEVEGTSRELCGGTHVGRTGDIGLFFVRQDSAVSSGVRRIEALTGTGAWEYVKALTEERNALASLLKASPDEIEARVRGILEEAETLKKKLGSHETKTVNAELEQILAASEEVKGIKFVSYTMASGDLNSLRSAGDRLREKMGTGVGLLMLPSSKKPITLVVVSDDLIRNEGLKANAIVAHVSSQMALRGGGKSHMAQVGLENPNDFEKIKTIVTDYLTEHL